MRQIKFRIWDLKGNPPQMYVDPFFTIPSNFRLSKAMKEMHEDGWIWMQFTGLNDKNGVEIFEGDILKGANESLCLVIFQAPSFVKKQTLKSKRWNEFILASESNQFEEIIGNIHENPELIENLKEK